MSNRIHHHFLLSAIAVFSVACGGDQATTAPALGYRSVTQNANTITNDSLRAIMAVAGCSPQRTGRVGSVIMAAVGGGRAFFDCSKAERPAMLAAIRRYVLNLGAEDGGSSLAATGYYLWEADNVTDLCGGEPYFASETVWYNAEPHEQIVNTPSGETFYIMVPAGIYRIEVWVDPSYPCGKVAAVSSGTWTPLAPGELPPDGSGPGDGSPPPPPEEAVRINYLTISPEEAEVDIGSVTPQFTLTAHYSNTTTGVVSTDHWSPAQLSIAAKDDNGTFVGLRAGTTAVWARIGTDSASASVTVRPCYPSEPNCKVALDTTEKALLDTVFQNYRRPLEEILDTMERRICAEAAARVAQALAQHPNTIFKGAWNSDTLHYPGQSDHTGYTHPDGTFHVEPFLLNGAMGAQGTPARRALLLRTMMHEMVHVTGGAAFKHDTIGTPGRDTMPFPFNIIESRSPSRSCVKP